MRFSSLKSSALVFGVAVAFIVGACSSGAGAGSGSGANNLTIGITTPNEGAELAVPFDVQLESNVPLGEPETGNHHAHLYFDTDTNAADYDIVYGNAWQVTRQLSPGEHTIIAALANPDHSLAGPMQQISVTVTGGGGGAASPAPPSASPGY